MPDGGVKMADDDNGAPSLAGRMDKCSNNYSTWPQGLHTSKRWQMGTNKKPLAGLGWSGKQQASLDLSEERVGKFNKKSCLCLSFSHQPGRFLCILQNPVISRSSHPAPQKRWPLPDLCYFCLLPLPLCLSTSITVLLNWFFACLLFEVALSNQLRCFLIQEAFHGLPHSNLGSSCMCCHSISNFSPSTGHIVIHSVSHSFHKWAWA